MVRSDASLRPDVTLPPGRSAFCRTSASRTLVMGSWYAASRSASTHTLMARGRPPTMRTSPTPGERSSCGRAILSAISVSSRSDRSLASAIVSTGD